MSNIRSSVNMSHVSNATHVLVPSLRLWTAGWGDQVTVSVAFVNFCFALTCFLVRYASVFWYTNKALTLVFAFQLLAMVLNSIFGYNSVSTLYCVCYNQPLYPNVKLSIGCTVDLLLYLFGSTILLLSTMTVFEYGSHYFHEKFKIVERHHNPESYIKQTVIVNSGCQGYVPHSCAMAALVVFAVCKGPLVYDLVSLMRLTDDQLLLSGVVCEVCYMVLWVALWFGLTVKQQWQFRILDYVPLQQPLYGFPDDNAQSRISNLGMGDSVHSDSLNRAKRISGTRETHPQRFPEPSTRGANSNSCEESYHSDMGTDESDNINYATEIVLDQDGNPISDPSHFRRLRGRRNGGQRVTFDESARNRASAEQETVSNSGGSLTRQGSHGPSRHDDANHVNVVADVHSSLPNNQDIGDEYPSQDVVLRKTTSGASGAQEPSPPLSKEYRNSIRSKCGEYYSSVNNLSGFEEPCAAQAEPLPTLMSSFRDKVRESSIAASNFKERERHMLEHYSYGDSRHPANGDTGETENCGFGEHNFVRGDSVDAEKRRCMAMPDADLSDEQYRYDNNKTALNSPSSSLPRMKHSISESSDEDHRSSITTSAPDRPEVGLPPLIEDIQYNRHRNSFGGHGSSNPATQGKENYGNMVGVPVTEKQSNISHHAHQHHPQFLFPRPVQIVAGKKAEIGRRDSANYSLTSSQDNSSNESDYGQGLCSQV